MPSRRIRLNQHAFPCNEDVDAILSGVHLPEGFLARMRALAHQSQRAETVGRDNRSAEVSSRLTSSKPKSSGPRRHTQKRLPSNGWDSFPSLLDL